MAISSISVFIGLYNNRTIYFTLLSCMKIVLRLWFWFLIILAYFHSTLTCNNHNQWRRSWGRVDIHCTCKSNNETPPLLILNQAQIIYPSINQSTTWHLFFLLGGLYLEVLTTFNVCWMGIYMYMYVIYVKLWHESYVGLNGLKGSWVWHYIAPAYIW